jgi:myo-inositol-1(or 4)-monophosphatase
MAALLPLVGKIAALADDGASTPGPPEDLSMSPLIELCERAARAGGKILLDYQHRVVGREKGPRDLVSEADLASQRAIQSILQAEFPSYDFLGEEDDPQALRSTDSDYCWIVDPLDGTTNYLHHLQAFAVVIALECRGEVVAGVVYDPVMNECFSAEKGQGAWLNGQRLGTSRCESSESALVAASFSPLVSRDSYEIKRFVEAIHHCQGVRRLGSAALNLSYVAAGRLDAYWATSVKIWDIAAGVLLVREAGGMVSHIEGGPLDLRKPELLATSTAALNKQLVVLLNP